jgi:hypothetical protein
VKFLGDYRSNINTLKSLSKSIAAIFIIILILLDALMVTYVVVNLRLNYPDTSQINTIYSPEIGNTYNPEFLSVFIYFDYNGTLSERKPVNMFVSSAR